jgi:predicted MFS family arabinose efflux permease
MGLPIRYMTLLQKQRLSIAAIFFMNGFGFANLMARLPEIQNFYGMTNSMLGTVLFCRAVGAVLAMPMVGWLSNYFGSNQITRTMGLIFVFLLPVLVSLPSVWLLGGVLFCLGVSEGIMDVNMNEQAVLIERGYGRPIMSSFHALFSGGMALGAGCGALMARLEIPMVYHYISISLFSLGLILTASQFFINTQKDAPITEGGKKPLFMLPTAAILPLGIIAFCGMTGEGAMVEWSTLFMKQVLLQNESLAALALVAFNVAMLLGRSIGDKINHKIGERNLLIMDSIAALVGMILILTFPYPIVALIGFFIVGLGLSTIVPIIYSAAGNTEGVTPSVGIAMATSIGYAGFFVGPPIIGYLSDLTVDSDLRWGLTFIFLLFAVMLYLIYRRK